MALILRDVLNRMVANAEALKRLQAESEEALDPDTLAHLDELLDEIGARTGRLTEAIHEAAMQRHVDLRVTPYQRRSGLTDRRHPREG